MRKPVGKLQVKKVWVQINQPTWPTLSPNGGNLVHLHDGHHADLHFDHVGKLPTATLSTSKYYIYLLLYVIRKLYSIHSYRYSCILDCMDYFPEEKKQSSWVIYDLVDSQVFQLERFDFLSRQTFLSAQFRLFNFLKILPFVAAVKY